MDTLHIDDLVPFVPSKHKDTYIITALCFTKFILVKSRKLMPKYSSPFIVKPISPNDRYVIEYMPGAMRSQKLYNGVCTFEHIISNVCKMKLYKIQSTDDTSSDLTGDDNLGKEM